MGTKLKCLREYVEIEAIRLKYASKKEEMADILAKRFNTSMVMMFIEKFLSK